MRRTMIVLVLMALVVGFVPILSSQAASTVGSFEIDGNIKDDTGAGEPIDWASTGTGTPPPTVTTFTDGTKSNDDGFTNGSKQEQPGSWTCGSASAPQKDDIVGGKVAFRTYQGKQYIYVNYLRREVNGSADLDYEFTQSAQPNPGCPTMQGPNLPKRTTGDLLIAFDANQGGSVITVRAFRWAFNSGSTTTGTYTLLATGSKGTTWDGAVNIPTDATDPGLSGVLAGAFGEAVLNLTDTIGTISCGQFASVFMKSRSSTSITSSLQDLTAPQPANVGECPNSNLTKAVRNVTTNGTFATTATAKPGDTLEYQLTYTNIGNVPATGVTVTDAIQPNQTLVANSCSPACTVTGNQLSWSLGTVQSNAAPITLTFRVALASSFPLGTTHVKNVGVVDSNEETPENSNETDTSVTASVAITSAKTISQQSANVGDTVHYTIKLSNSGNQAGTTNVTDDYDQAHLTITNITGGGVNNGNTIVWSNVSVPPGTNTVMLEYDGTVKGPFTTGAGTGGCQPGQFPVVNNVTLSNGTGTSATLCVNGQAAITSVKSVSPTVANEGDTVHYSIKLSNSGNIAGTTTIVDDYDEAHIAVSNISNGGVDDGTKITWTNISVPVGANTVTLTYDGLVKVGSFTTGTPGGAPCTGSQFKVHNTVTLSTGGGSGADLCVNGKASITPQKTADKQTANVGDQVHYSIKLTNSGNVDGTVSPVDDYDQAHVTVSAISNGGVDNGNTITWTNIVVPANSSVTLTYTGTIHGPFSGGSGTCNPGQFPVINTVTITGGSSTNTVCVNASPDLHLVKSADKTIVLPGNNITYTLAYSNTGPAEAKNVVITEAVPPGTTFVSCTGTPTCQQSGGTVTWNIGTVASGGSGSVTMTVNITNTAGCTICNTASIQSPDQGSSTAVLSNQLCVGQVPGPDASTATAGGNASGAFVQSSLLGINTTLPAGNDGAGDPTSVDSFRMGVGSSAESNQLLAVDVPPPAPGSVLHADVLRAESVGTVTALPDEAVGASVGSAANVNILNGTVTATLVRGYANATATGTAATVSSIGSAIQGLNVLGIPQAVFPGARVDLPSAIFGPGSYVAIYEEIKNTQTPSGTFGGTYGGDITVNMIRVHITNMLVVGQAEVIVGHARAVATFPQTTLCGPQANQSVSGHAFVARVLTDPSIAPVIVGPVEIPTNGGTATNSVNQIAVDPLVTSKTATSTTTGSFTAFVTTASSFAEVKSVCVLKTGSACTIAAQLVRAQANSTAALGTRSSNSSGTDFVGLKIGGVVVSLPVGPNTVITLPGIGFVILNEQFCDNGGTLATNCSNGTVPGHTGLTVRAIHVVLLDPAAGGSPGVDIIVSEAHSDARFV